MDDQHHTTRIGLTAMRMRGKRPRPGARRPREGYTETMILVPTVGSRVRSRKEPHGRQ